MNLLFWNVYLNYSTYFIKPIKDLGEAARQLVANELCEAAYSTDGLAYWKTKTEVREYPISIKRLGYSSEAEIQLPQGLSGYSAECIYQASYMRYFELLLFNQIFLEQTAYVRAFMQPALFSFEQKRIILYPQVKLYQNGVMTICFRIIAPNHPYPINDLIENEINLYKHNADDIQISPALFGLNIRVPLSHKNNNPASRYRTLRSISFFNRIINENNENFTYIKFKDFSHKFISIKPFEELAEDQPILNLNILIEYISSAIALVLNRPNQGIKYFIFGAKKLRLQPGGYWIMRPNICILDFEDQPDTASEIVHKFNEELGRVLARSSSIPREKAIEMLPESSRLYEDFILYINKALGVCIYSRQAFEREEQYKDANKSELIFPIQVKFELVDYIHLSYLRHEERSLEFADTISELFHEKRNLLHIDRLVRYSTSYGEIGDLFNYAWQCLDIEEIKQNIYENIELKLQKLQEYRDKRNNQFSSLLAISFGIVGVTSLAKDVVEPMWKSLGWWLPPNTEFQPLFLFGVTVAGILIALALLWLWASRVQKDSF